jgi:acyl-CoA synthetase (AMP-forming)/AMP-acid ligase II
VLIDLVREHAAADPGREFVVEAGRTITYKDASARADVVAGGLAARGLDRVACLLDDPYDVITFLCAASAAGAEACVYPRSASDADIAVLANAFGHRTIVTERALDGVDAETIPFAALENGAAVAAAAPPSAPVLILTTGTTGVPKGARHEWSRLAAGVRRRADSGEARWLLAYNLNQFAGLQVLLHALVGGAALVGPESNQPRAALVAMRELRVTHASATPTFWRFLLTMVDENAAASIPLRQITLGGEAVPEAVIAQLRRTFPTAKISQIYASTEFGSSVSVGDERSGLPVSVLSRGDDADVQFKLVDGELYARSRVGMLGYVGQADDEGWRPTGDLVVVDGDRLRFVGRTSEIINVGGVKVHPLQIEELVAAVDTVALARVYGKPNPVAGQIVAVDVVARDDADPDATKAAVRAACKELPAAAQPRLIRVVDALELRENKIARRAQETAS